MSELRGHPGATQMVQAVLPAGVFTSVTKTIAVYQDSGYPVRVVVQITNLCRHIRRPDAPACCLPIDHPGAFHANEHGEAWEVDPA